MSSDKVETPAEALSKEGNLCADTIIEVIHNGSLIDCDKFELQLDSNNNSESDVEGQYQQMMKALDFRQRLFPPDDDDDDDGESPTKKRKEF